MSKCYRVIFETYDKSCPEKVLSKKEIIEDELKKPSNCLDFGMGFTNQLAAVKGIQDAVLLEKIRLLQENQNTCPECENKMSKFGSHTSSFHDVLTDHRVEIPRMKCLQCKYETPSTVRTIINDRLSGGLKKYRLLWEQAIVTVKVRTFLSYSQTKGATLTTILV